MQKNYSFSKKQEGTVLITDLKVKSDSSKKHPLYGGLKPPHPSPPYPPFLKLYQLSTLELDGYGWQWKNPLLFSITWTGFRWCENRDSLNFMAFSGGFLVALTSSNIIFQNWVFKRKRDVPKVDGFGLFLGPVYLQKIQNIANNQIFSQNLHLYDYQITQAK